MEYKWKAVIQHFRFLVPALAQPTVRPSRIKTFEYDLVIKFGGDFALFGQDQPRFSGDQSNVYGVAGKAARQVENEAGKATDSDNVQGGRMFRCRVQLPDVDALCLHFLQAPAVLRFFSLVKSTLSVGHGFLQKC